MQKPTNPTSAFLNLKSSIDTPQSSEKCCFLLLSWLFWSFHLLKSVFLFPLSPCIDCTRLCKYRMNHLQKPSYSSVGVLYSFHIPQSAQWFVWWILIFQTHFFHKQSFFYHECMRVNMFSVFCKVWICSQVKNSHMKAPNTYWWMRIWIIWIPLLFVIIMFIHTVIAKSARMLVFEWISSICWLSVTQGLADSHV